MQTVKRNWSLGVFSTRDCSDRAVNDILSDVGFTVTKMSAMRLPTLASYHGQFRPSSMSGGGTNGFGRFSLIFS